MELETVRTVSRVVLALAMTGIGVLHFVAPKGFIRIVPKSLPNPRLLVLVSGAFEILGGVGLLVPFARTFSAWGLVALYVAVFPANVNMAVNRIQLPGTPLPVWALWARLPLQLVFIAWAIWVR